MSNNGQGEILKSEFYSTQVNEEKHLDYPSLLISAYLFLDYVRPQDLFPVLNSFHLGAIFSVLLGLTWILKGKKNFSNRNTILFIIFLFLMGKNILIAHNNYWAFQQTIIMAITFICYYIYLLAFLDSAKKIRKFLYFFIFIHILLAFLGIKNEGQGTGNFLKDENDFSLAINMVIPYSLFLSQDTSEPLWKRFIFLATIILFLAVNILTYSRGGFLGMISVFLFFFIMQKNKFRWAIILTAFVILFLFLVPEKYDRKMKTIVRSDKSGWDTGDVRLNLWGNAWKMFLDHPILGVGPANFQWNIQEYESIDETNEMLNISRGGKVSHSLYFTLLPELGIPGVLVFGMMVFKNIGYLRSTAKLMRRNITGKKIIRQEAEEMHLLKQTHMVNKIMVGSLVGYLISGIFVSVLYYPHFWILSGVMVASMNIFRRNYNKGFKEDV